MLRRYLVDPAEMWWPSNLAQVSLFRLVFLHHLFFFFLPFIIIILCLVHRNFLGRDKEKKVVSFRFLKTFRSQGPMITDTNLSPFSH